MATHNSQHTVSPEDLMRYAQMQRNFERARNAQRQKIEQKKEHYMKNIGQQVGASHAVAPRTESQKKHALREKQNNNVQNKKKKDNSAAKKILIKKHMRIIRNYERKIWTLLYVAAFAGAFFDVLTIPILSTMMSFCTSLYINVGLWNVGEPNKRARLRLLRAGVSTLDLVPIINLIPFSVLLVYKTHEEEQKRVKRSRNIVKKVVV
jgi:hypothetical protein